MEEVFSAPPRQAYISIQSCCSNVEYDDLCKETHSLSMQLFAGNGCYVVQLVMEEDYCV
jgi:hypothetical protein